MFVNCDKFQAILLVKQKSDCAGTKLTVGSEETKVVSSVEVLSITIGTKYSGMDQVKFSLSRPYPFKYFKGYLQQIVLGPFLNTLSQLIINWILI